MGWWESEEGLIGDGPVDLIEDVMAEWTESHQPTWQELVDGIGTALLDRGHEWLGDSESLEGGRIRAEFAPPAVDIQSNPTAPRGRFHEMWSQAFQQVAEEYEETQLRKPMLSEVLGTIDFSLGVAPERFVRDDEGRQLVTLQAQKAEGPA